MEKLTSILAVVEDAPGGRIVFEKAVRLATEVGARLELLVLQTSLSREFSELRAKRPELDIVLSSAGNPAETTAATILAAARARQPDLVVKHSAERASLRRPSLDAQDWHLAHDLPMPLMLVRDGSWHRPPRFAAAVDVSDEHRQDLARAILHTAGFLALECDAELDVIYSEPDENDGRLSMERAIRLARMVREFRVGCERIQHLVGQPQVTLPALIQEHEYDCVMLGSTRRHGLESFKEGVTSRLFDAARGDVLFVKPTGWAAASDFKVAPVVTAATAI
jgi:nucleotide-binding universal stress UspA family protein